jgi:formate dehydrogenase beta subunit
VSNCRLAERAGSRKIPICFQDHPDYFHKSWTASGPVPAHTDVPEYIRLIAQGQFTEAYMLNREVQCIPRHSRSRLRPALRAGLPARRVEKKPVAICRLKRVAADQG